MNEAIQRQNDAERMLEQVSAALISSQAAVQELQVGVSEGAAYVLLLLRPCFGQATQPP